jgi:hypothetical protein
MYDQISKQRASEGFEVALSATGKMFNCRTIGFFDAPCLGTRGRFFKKEINKTLCTPLLNTLEK